MGHEGIGQELRVRGVPGYVVFMCTTTVGFMNIEYGIEEALIEHVGSKKVGC